MCKAVAKLLAAAAVFIHAWQAFDRLVLLPPVKKLAASRRFGADISTRTVSVLIFVGTRLGKDSFTVGSSFVSEI